MFTVSGNQKTFRIITTAAAFALASLMPLQNAFAAGNGGGNGGGGGGGGGGGNGGGSADSSTCPRGQVWSRSQRKCVRQQGSVIPDEELTDYAFALAEEDRFEEALDVLNLLDNPDTPKALNYRGYVLRHLGKLDEGIGFYLKSVQLDPQYAQVREYLGEAYVIKGHIDLAKEQLAIIETLCGTECEEYEDLAEAIADPSSL